MHRTFFFLTILTACFTVAATAQGQDAPEGQADRPAGRSIRFACTSIAPGTPEILWMPKPQGKNNQAKRAANANGFVEVQLSTRIPGNAVRIAPSNAVIALGEKPAADQPFQPLAKIKVPDKLRKGIALLIPNGKKQGLRYHIHLIDEVAFKNGDVYLLNLTTKPFQVRMDQKKINLEKGKNHIYRPQNLRAPKNVPVQIFCKFSNIHTKDEKWRLITASTWRLRPTRKEFCIFFWDAARQRPAIKSLTALPPIKKPR